MATKPTKQTPTAEAAAWQPKVTTGKPPAEQPIDAQSAVVAPLNAQPAKLIECTCGWYAEY